MAELHGINSRIFIDEVNVSGYTSSYTFTVNVDLAESQTLADTWKERLSGHLSGSLAFTSFFDTVDGGFDEFTFTDLSTDSNTQRLGMFNVGTTAGSVCYEVPGKYSGQERSAPYDGIVGLSGTLESSTGISRGQSILFEDTITATGAQTGYNIGAVAAGGTTVAVFRVHSITGTIAMDIEESSDDGSGDAYGAIAALASGNITTASVVRKTTTAATEAWKRVNVTTAPTTASVTVTVTSY